MKLRNKKTGEIVDVWSVYDRTQVINLKYFTDTGVANLKYDTLAELNEEWEDVGDKNDTNTPLIKDEKIRKAVRAWAEANRVAETRYSSCHDAECEFNARDDENKSIVFIGNFVEMNERLDYSGRTIYTIAELCGEEEE